MAEHDPVNSPHHYTSLGAVCSNCGEPIECITITEKFDFNIGNAIKYLWRAGLKNGLQDLQKARWYVNRAATNEENRLAVKATPEQIAASEKKLREFYTSGSMPPQPERTVTIITNSVRKPAARRGKAKR